MKKTIAMSCIPMRPPEDIPCMFIEGAEVAIGIDVVEAMDIVEDIGMSMPDIDVISIVEIDNSIVLQNNP